jgi:hypothetical protein
MQKDESHDHPDPHTAFARHKWRVGQRLHLRMETDKVIRQAFRLYLKNRPKAESVQRLNGVLRFSKIIDSGFAKRIR